MPPHRGRWRSASAARSRFDTHPHTSLNDSMDRHDHRPAPDPDEGARAPASGMPPRDGDESPAGGGHRAPGAAGKSPPTGDAPAAPSRPPRPIPPRSRANRSPSPPPPSSARASAGQRGGGSAPVPAPQPPLSHLAVVAMACAVLACCPLAGIAAMVLGVMAMRVTEGERPRRRGRRLALAAVVIGSAMLIVDFGLLRWWQQTSLARMHDEMEQVVRTALDGATLGDVDVVLGEWAGNGALPRPEAVDRFGEALRQRLGRYRGMSIVN